MVSAEDPPPGGWENEEIVTDIGAVILGFGIFAANSAFRFQQYTTPYSQGWKTTGFGYLTEKEFAYALAIFLELKKIPPKQAYPYCRANIKSYVKQAMKDLHNDNLLTKLRK